MVCVAVVPIVYILAGKVIYDFRVRRFDMNRRQARLYGLYYGAVVALAALFQAFATVLFSPGGPIELKPYTAVICVVYAALMAVLDFQAWKVLARSKLEE
jgi:hypothetical protein